MKIIELEQGTPEWLQWRKEGIGATDISVIMGNNPYKKLIDFWKEKHSMTSDTINEAMEHGKEEEPKAREWLEKFFESPLPSVCVEEEEVPYFRASIDGINLDRQILIEIKCPYTKDPKEMAQRPPKMYIDQMQWQMMLTGYNMCYFSVWDKNIQECFIKVFPADLSYQETLKDEAHKAWKLVVDGTPPPEEYAEISDNELEVLLHEYRLWSIEEKNAALAKKELLEKILKKTEGRSVVCNNVKMKYVDGRISYDIEQMKKDGVIIENYQKKGKESYRLFFPKAKVNNEKNINENND